MPQKFLGYSSTVKASIVMNIGLAVLHIYAQHNYSYIQLIAGTICWVIKYIPPKLPQKLLGYSSTVRVSFTLMWFASILISYTFMHNTIHHSYTRLILQWMSAWRKQITLCNSHLAETTIVTAMFKCLQLNWEWWVGVRSSILHFSQLTGSLGGLNKGWKKKMKKKQPL